MNYAVVKVLGLVAAVLGLTSTMLGDWAKDKEIERKIDERIDAKLADDEEEEEE